MRNLKRALSLALASVMLLGMMVVGTSAASFPDVDGNDNIEAIDVLKTVEVMIGNENGDFEPDKNVTRAEMAVVMAKLLNLDYKYYETTCPFNDVPDWAKGWVGACAANGIVSGRGEGVYDPNASVTAVEAASMMMRALGYFQHSGDYEKGFEASTVAQASKISLFSGINGNARDPMTRNQVAQLALNTLEARMVEFTGDMGFEANGISIGYKSEYTYRTGTQSRYRAIREDGPTNSVAGGTSQYYVQLGEQLYNGDLKKVLDRDNFNRLVYTWSYKSTEIGKYIDEDTVMGTWTGKVTEKDVYDAVGSAAYNNYTWEVWQNGGLIAEGAAARRAVFAHGTTSSERVLTTGNGVLTEVFVDNSLERVVVSLIDTGVAKVIRVDEKNGEYEVTVSFRTRVSNGNKAQINPDNKFTTPVKFERDDIVLYTASASTNDIESLAVAESVSGTVTTQKDSDYTILGSDTYNYNYAYTKKLADNGVCTGATTGLYNLEDGEGGKNPAINKEVTLYLDAYGSIVAYEGKVTTAEDYLFVTEVGEVFKSEPSAKVVFSDGTKATITVDDIIANDKHYDAVSGTPTDASKQRKVTEDTIYKFTKNSSSYDLEEVDQLAGTAASIKKDNPTITATGTANNAVTNGNTAFVDAVNGKAQVGYRNISSKSKASVALVTNKNGVAEVVFIYGSFTEEAAADDFIVLSGIGYEQVVIDGKTVYRMKDAYDVNGVAIDECYVASKSEADKAVKGLMRVSKRNSDEQVSEWAKVLTAIDNVGLKGDGTAKALYYAESASAGLLKLNTTITFNSQNKSTFGYNDDTEFVVIDLNKGNTDIDRVRNGGVDDIEAWETGAGVDNTDVTCVYVMTIDDSSKDAPMAESVLVVVPNNGSAGSDAGNQGPSAGDDAEQLTSYSTVKEVNAALREKNVKINGTWNPSDKAGQNLIIPQGKTLEIVGDLNFGDNGAVGFANKTSSALVVSGTLTLKQDTIDGIVSAGSLVLKKATTINADVTVANNLDCSADNVNVTVAKDVTVKVGGDFKGHTSATLTNRGHLEVTGAISGWANAKEFSGNTMIAKKIIVGTLTVGENDTTPGRVQVSEAIQATTVTVTNGNVQTAAISDQAGSGAATNVTVTKGSLTATGTLTGALTIGGDTAGAAKVEVGTLTGGDLIFTGKGGDIKVNEALNATDIKAKQLENGTKSTITFAKEATRDSDLADSLVGETGGAATDDNIGGSSFVIGGTTDTASDSDGSTVTGKDETVTVPETKNIVSTDTLVGSMKSKLPAKVTGLTSSVSDSVTSKKDATEGSAARIAYADAMNSWKTGVVDAVKAAPGIYTIDEVYTRAVNWQKMSSTLASEYGNHEHYVDSKGDVYLHGWNADDGSNQSALAGKARIVFSVKNGKNAGDITITVTSAEGEAKEWTLGNVAANASGVWFDDGKDLTEGTAYTWTVKDSQGVVLNSGAFKWVPYAGCGQIYE